MRKYIGPIILGVVALLIIFGGAIVGLYTDWLWFDDLGYGTIFSTILLTKVKIGLVLGILFFGIIYGNLWYARRIAPPPSPLGIEQQLLERLGRLARRGIGLLLFGGSIVVSAMVGLEAATHWEEWLKYINSVPFGTADPIFSKDIGFYVFQLPLLNYIYKWLFFALVASTIASAGLHYADEAIEVFDNRFQFAPKVKGHLCILIALMFFLKAWGYRLSMYGLLSTKGDLFDGAGFTMVNATIPALWIMVAAAVIGGVLVLANIVRRGIGLAVSGLVVVIAASILVGGAYPAMVKQFSVDPNELEKESPYIEKAITATRWAYGITNVAAQPFAAEKSLTVKQVEQNSSTIENIRLWDHERLLDAYGQIQTIQQYYNFHDVDVDRYQIAARGGKKRYRQVWLSARELSQSSLPTKSQTWINKHLQYTHGYGLCMSPVNEVSVEGLPEFFLYDIPPKTKVDLEVEQPGVYFGEMTDAYVFVNTAAAEFDYPTGAETQTTTYKAPSGVGVGGFFRKLMFALRFSDVNILLNEDLTSDSRVLFNRDISERVRTLFPFLQFDTDPYLVTVGGGMYWLQDAYTVTDAYPYSQHLDAGVEFNYIRNSVKIVIDAYTGAVSAYVISVPLDDPIIKAYQKMFPGVFQPIAKMPRELYEHIRYPEDLFRIQTSIYRRYHMKNPTTFYNNSDLWDIARRAELVSPSEEAEPMKPYYMIMKRPDGKREEFLLMTPYIRAGKKNMVSWICARCDVDNYGELVLYQFPKDKNVYGPQQVASRARQDTEISRQVTLWSQQGSSVGSGNLLVIPIESSLLYVMPVYLESTTTKIPELKRVIVALGDKVAMEPTLQEALSAVVGQRVATEPEAKPAPAAKPGSSAKPEAKPTAPAAEVSSDVSRLIDEAVSQYESAQEAQKRGEWAEYGRQVDALEKTLKQLRARTQ